MVAAASRKRQARRMTGGGLLELILISMGGLFFLAGLAANYQVLGKSLRAKPDEPLPANLGFIPGVVGSITLFFTLPALAKYGIDVPWPWLWILLPLLIDPYCLGGLVLLLLRK
jgi:hypothetical protein